MKLVAMPAMIEGMAAAEERERGNAAVALRVLRDPRAVPVLLRAVDDPSPYVRTIAMEALGELNAREAFDKIAARLKDKENGGSDVPMFPAAAACYALGELGDERAAPLLTEAAADPDLRSSAERGLRRLKERRDAGREK